MACDLRPNYSDLFFFVLMVMFSLHQVRLVGSISPLYLLDKDSVGGGSSLASETLRDVTAVLSLVCSLLSRVFRVHRPIGLCLCRSGWLTLSSPRNEHVTHISLTHISLTHMNTHAHARAHACTQVHDSTHAFGPTALPKMLDSGVVLLALRGAESPNTDVSSRLSR